MQFTRLIKINGHLQEFNFTKGDREKSGTFSIDTVDERGNRICFSMTNAETGWEILPESFIPGWILDVQPQLNNCIEEEFQQLANHA